MLGHQDIETRQKAAGAQNNSHTNSKPILSLSRVSLLVFGRADSRGVWPQLTHEPLKKPTVPQKEWKYLYILTQTT